MRYQSAYYSVSPPVHENGYRLERVKFKEIPQISSSSRQQNLRLLDVFDYIYILDHIYNKTICFLVEFRPQKEKQNGANPKTIIICKVGP